MSRQFSALIASSLLLFYCGGSEPPTEENQETGEDSALLMEFVQQPPEQLIAGELLDASVSVYRGEEPVAGVEVLFSLQGLHFGDGEDSDTSVVEADGIAGISRSLRQATRGAVLLATVEDEDGSEVTVTSRPFDVVAADADAGESFIEGADGFVGDEVVVDVGLFDRFGNPLQGVAPTIELTGVGELVGECSGSDEAGLSTCIVTSDTAGETSPTLVDPVNVTGDPFWFVSPDCDRNGVPFGGGDGSHDNPYAICSEIHLQAIGTSSDYLAASFELHDNVDLSSVASFQPIGDEEAPFEGSIHGNRWTIGGLQLHRPDDHYVGLFGVIGSAGTVTALHLADVMIHGQHSLGALAGGNHGTVVDVHATGSVQGLSGVGLLLGNVYETGIVEASSSMGTVETSFGGIGGLVGSNYGTVREAFSSASVNVSGESNSSLAGGLIGGNSGEVYDSYATGDITAEGQNVGGLTGRAWTTVARSYSTGTVEVPGNPDDVGGFVGLPHFGAVEDCYWDVESSGRDHDRGADPLETADFSDMANFPGWDFDNVWIIGTAPDGVTRPILRWQLETED